MKWDMTKVVEEIAMQAKENQEEFIFETIHPYCENILQMKINKEELNRIILRGVRPKGHWIIIDDCELFMAKCSECGEIVDSRMINKYPYCHCGAEMSGGEEDETDN